MVLPFILAAIGLGAVGLYVWNNGGKSGKQQNRQENKPTGFQPVERGENLDVGFTGLGNEAVVFGNKSDLCKRKIMGHAVTSPLQQTPGEVVELGGEQPKELGTDLGGHIQKYGFGFNPADGQWASGSDAETKGSNYGWGSIGNISKEADANHDWPMDRDPSLEMALEAKGCWGNFDSHPVSYGRQSGNYTEQQLKRGF